MEKSEVFRSIVIQKEMKNGDWSIKRRSTLVAAPRVHWPASPEDRLGEATREGPRGVDYSLARARRIIEVRRGWSPSSLPALPKILFEESRGWSSAGALTRSHEERVSSKVQRGEDDAGWCRSSQPASRREGDDRVTRDGATRDRLPAPMTENPRRWSDAGWLTRVVPVHFYPSRNLSLVGF